MIYKRIPALLIVAFFALPAAAQNTCSDGFEFNPDEGICVEIPGNGTTQDDGTEPQLLRFLTPDDQDTFDTGTSVAPTGRSTLSLVQDLPIDLTVILDQSGSMNQLTNVLNDETTNPNDFFTQFELAGKALTSLIQILPESAEITLIHFADQANLVTTKMGVGPFAPGNQSFFNRFRDIIPNGGTRLDLALDQHRNIANLGASTGLYLPDDYDRELLILTDGEPTQDIPLSELFFLGGFGDVTAVALPGSSPEGLTFLERLTSVSGGQLLDYQFDAQGFLDSFLGDNLLLTGLAGVEITDPNGRTYAAQLDAFGQFELDPYSLQPGDNVFTARASFLDGTEAIDTLTLFGTGSGPTVGTGGDTTTPVPLPAAGWLLMVALVGCGALGRKQKAT